MPRALRRVPPVRRWTHVAVLAMAGAVAALAASPTAASVPPGVVRLPPAPDDPVPTDPARSSA